MLWEALSSKYGWYPSQIKKEDAFIIECYKNINQAREEKGLPRQLTRELTNG